MADLHYLAINFKFESLCIKSKKKRRVVFTTGVLQWLVTVCCCACHLIKMSYLLVLVVPCYQFKLGWRICNINWSYFFVFRFFHQEFKVLILSFAVFVVVASGATVYKSRADEKKVRWQTDTFWCTYCFSNFIPVMVYRRSKPMIFYSRLSFLHWSLEKQGSYLC